MVSGERSNKRPGSPGLRRPFISSHFLFQVKSQAHVGHLQTVLPTHHHHHRQQQQQQQQRFPVTLRASLMKKFNQNQPKESAKNTSATGVSTNTGRRSPADESALVAPHSSSDYSTIMSDSTTSNNYSANQPQHHYAVLDSNWPGPSPCTTNYPTVASTGSCQTELPRRRLKFIEKLGEGGFGEVIYFVLGCFFSF